MAGFGEVVGGFSGGKGKLLILAALITGAGLVISKTDILSSPKDAPVATSSQKTVSSDWRENSKTRVVLEERSQRWGDAAVRFGMSFGIAMIAASLLRVFLKTMIVVFLVTGGVLFLLYTQGMIEPFWNDYFDSADQAGDWASSQKETIQQFLVDYVPSMGAALVGFGFGLRK